MPDVPLPLANALYKWSGVILTIGAALVLDGTAGGLWFDGVRERYADERISGNEAKTAKANADAAFAAESNTRLTLELERERVERLRLEQRVAPRQLSDDQRRTLSSEIASFGWHKAEIIWVGDGEPESYARNIASAFESANVKTFIHTLGPFIPSAWGLNMVIITNDDSKHLKGMFDRLGVVSVLAKTNDTLGAKNHPTIVVGARTDYPSAQVQHSCDH